MLEKEVKKVERSCALAGGQEIPSHFAVGQEATIQLNIPHCVVSSLCVNEAT